MGTPLISNGVEKLGWIAMEVAREAVSASHPDHAGHDQIGLSNAAPKAWLSSIPVRRLRESTRASWRNVAGNTAGERELLEQFLHARSSCVTFEDLTPGAFEVDVAHQRRAAVAGTGNVDIVQVIFLDDPVQVHVDEVLPRHRAPVTDHQRLHMREFQRLFQQRLS